MESLTLERTKPDRKGIALKAYGSGLKNPVSWATLRKIRRCASARLLASTSHSNSISMSPFPESG